MARIVNIKTTQFIKEGNENCSFVKQVSWLVNENEKGGGQYLYCGYAVDTDAVSFRSFLFLFFNYRNFIDKIDDDNIFMAIQFNLAGNFNYFYSFCFVGNEQSVASVLTAGALNWLCVTHARDSHQKWHILRLHHSITERQAFNQFMLEDIC